MGRQRTFVAIAASVALLVSGCSQSSEDGSPLSSAAASIDAAAEDLLRTSAEATKKLTSAHIKVDLKGEFDRVGQATAIEGDAQAKPLVVNGQVTYRSGSVAPLIVADDTVSVEIGGTWNEVGATSVVIPPTVIDLSGGLPTLMESLETAHIAGQDTIEGIATTRIAGTMPIDTVKELLPEATGPADVSVWVRASGTPVLARTVIDFSTEKAITVTVSNWDAPVTVRAVPMP
ncbi:MAG: LppX_LprAFG lipoprotein [Mycobacterium sp.]